MVKKGLGRGLGALIPDYDENAVASGAVELKLIDVEPNGSQPRSDFDKEKLRELADSITAHGVIQPILVVKNGARYQIIAGERRWRASKLAGLKTIPAIVRDYDELKVFEVALIENLQREDLNPIEEASGYKSLIDRFGMTQEKISERVGKSRSAVANALRLLSLPSEAVALISAGTLSVGHAKVILSLPARLQAEAARQIAAKGLTVRETEAYVKSLLHPARSKTEEHSELKAYLSSIETDVSRAMGTKVRIRHGASSGKGKIEIQYYSNEDLERLLNRLVKK
ncbi:MAG: ParB/RepB/Spo0J family partition protein [Clostridiales bacterium]|jgi:ParB family chromosome partitioning protein|nr:ParB/RepB/Spo0J family partition protein [Clostridiales bacterium]